LLKQISKNTKSWHEAHFNEMVNLQTMYEMPNSTRVSTIIPKENKEIEMKFNTTDRINSKTALKNENNSALLSKCHMNEQLQYFNARIKNQFEKHVISKSCEKIELFSLNKRILHQKNKRTFSQIPSSLVFCNKILNGINLKKKEELEKIWKQRESESFRNSEIKTVTNKKTDKILREQLQTARKENKDKMFYRKSSLHENGERVIYDKNIKNLKKIFNF